MALRGAHHVASVAVAVVVSIAAAWLGWYASIRFIVRANDLPSKIQGLLNSPENQRLLPRFSERSAVQTFYRLRGFAPIWIDDGKLNDRGLAVIRFLSRADDEGLDPDDYQISLAPTSASAARLAAMELATTAAVVRYARHVQFGRIASSNVDRNTQFGRRPFGVTQLLGELAARAAVKDVLGALSPPLPQYQALKARLAQWRAEIMSSTEVTSKPDRRPAVIANMERWRWFPRDLGSTNVIVNIPQFQLTFTQDGVAKFVARVVVGEPALPTPVLSASMTSITLNPTWNVPDQMVEREFIPKLAQDPHLLDRLGLKADRRADGTLHVYQIPGDLSAVGRVRFNFPNKFLVYQHDTPDQNLFGRQVRAYSHGCIRVENALFYAGSLLSSEHPGEQYPPERLYAIFGDNEIEFKFPNPIPVHLTYQTAYVGDDGALVLLADIYGLDSRTLAALQEFKNSQKDLGVAVQRPAEPRSLLRRALDRLGQFAATTRTAK
jgi:murein L,D-transpeptidase YcbB/YkuD